MDNALYIAANGAARVDHAQGLHAHNLANVSTTGFRADLARTMASDVTGDGFAARSYSMNLNNGFDTSDGMHDPTGRSLDIAINGAGFIAVQMPDGREGYTRSGGLSIDEFGRVHNGQGLPVLGESGPVVLPPLHSLDIAVDGSITVRPQGKGPDTLVQVDRIKLVRPLASHLIKDPSGVIVRTDGGTTPASAEARVVSGYLETSNVNAVAELMNVLELARSFELQVRLMKTAESNDEASQNLLRLG